MKGAAKVVDFNADAEVEAAPLHPAATPVVASSEADKALTLKEASNISFGPRAEAAGSKQQQAGKRRHRSALDL